MIYEIPYLPSPGMACRLVARTPGYSNLADLLCRTGHYRWHADGMGRQGQAMSLLTETALAIRRILDYLPSNIDTGHIAYQVNQTEYNKLKEEMIEWRRNNEVEWKPTMERLFIFGILIVPTHCEITIEFNMPNTPIDP
jgi:hypothetical protein